MQIVVSPTSAALGSPTLTDWSSSRPTSPVLNPTQAQASLTNNVIDRPGTVAFGSPTYSVPETAGSATLTVVRTAGERGTVTVHYATVPVNATPGMDYTPVSGTLTFGDRRTSQTIVVPVLANPYDRTNELVNVVLPTSRPPARSSAPRVRRRSRSWTPTRTPAISRSAR